MGNRLGDFFRGELAVILKVQNVVLNRFLRHIRFHGVLPMGSGEIPPEPAEDLLRYSATSMLPPV
jgi:hypothetical protein